MARIRTIKPDFWTDEKVVELSPYSRLLFIGLWNFADDEGRMECSPKRIKMQILPADSAEVPRLLDELESLDLVRRYTVEGIEYLQVNGFGKHQKVDKRSASKYPPPPVIHKSVRRLPPSPPDGMEGNGREGNKTPEVISAVVTETTPASPPAAETTPAEAGTPKPGSVAGQAAAALDALRVTPPVGTDQHAKAGELWAVLAANGCKGTASHPTVIEMVAAGVTVEEIRKAIAKARQSKDGPLSPAYLAAIVSDLRANPGKANGKSAAWATDERATEAKARELGLWPARGGESWDDLRGRIRAQLSRSAEESVR